MAIRMSNFWFDTEVGAIIRLDKKITVTGNTPGIPYGRASCVMFLTITIIAVTTAGLTELTRLVYRCTGHAATRLEHVT